MSVKLRDYNLEFEINRRVLRIPFWLMGFVFAFVAYISAVLVVEARINTLGGFEEDVYALFVSDDPIEGPYLLYTLLQFVPWSVGSKTFMSEFAYVPTRMDYIILYVIGGAIAGLIGALLLSRSCALKIIGVLGLISLTVISLFAVGIMVYAIDTG